MIIHVRLTVMAGFCAHDPSQSWRDFALAWLRSLRLRLVHWPFVVLVTACAAAPPRPPDAPDVPGDSERHYAIWLGGAQVGTARETETWSPGGVALQRTEAMRFLRGEALVALATTIDITADRMLAPSRVVWTERA